MKRAAEQSAKRAVDRALEQTSQEFLYEAARRLGSAKDNHPLVVASGFLPGSVGEMVALLHDVVEDEVVTFVGLRALGFPPEVVNDVDTLTRRSGELYASYIERVFSKGSHVALRVKIADCEHNLERCPVPLRSRYVRALRTLRES